MEHTRTTHEQSVILKKIGYDFECDKYYDSDGSEVDSDCMDKGKYWGTSDIKELTHLLPKPKLTDVATWLRTVRNLHVYVRVMEGYWCYDVQDAVSGKFRANSHYYYDTHDLALSAGIDFILTKLNEDDHHPTN